MRLGILRGIPIVALAVVSLIAGSTPASANHSWSTYHWARTSNSFTLQLGNNMSSLWPSYLGQTSTDWNANTTAFPTVLTTAVVAGTSGGNCRAVAGTTQVCNKNYGFNGWLGLASIWISGGHITQGTAKMNDSYFGLSTYNNPNEKQHVVCQEVAHTFGLAHQDESGASLNTCMDYFSNTGANATSTLSTKPNAHDFEQLATIYGAHTDSTSTVKAIAVTPTKGAAADGTPFGASPARGAYYLEDLGNGQYLLTHVFWAPRGR